MGREGGGRGEGGGGGRERREIYMVVFSKYLMQKFGILCI